MKTLFTLIAISICSIGFGQVPITVTDEVKLEQLGLLKKIPFDALNGAQIQEADNAAKYAHKTDSIKWVIVRSMVAILQAKGEIDPLRISTNGDSLKITPQGMEMKFKPKKK